MDRILQHATEADLVAGSYLALDTADKTKRLPSNMLIGFNFAILLHSLDSTYPKFDFTAKTLTFGGDTLVLYSKNKGGVKRIASSLNPVVVSFAEDVVGNTSAVKIVYNISTNEVYAAKFDTAINEYEERILATIRTSTKCVSMVGPFYVDGQLFGAVKDVADEVVFTGNVKGINHRGYNTIAPEPRLEI